MADKLQMLDIDSIIVEDRARIDLGNIEGLKASIIEKGVIQPITVSKDSLRLLAGGRRYTAAKMAGLKKIPALLRDNKDEAVDNAEIELIENTFRKDFTWQEQTALIAKLDRLMREKHGTEWSTRKTAGLLGQSHPMNVVRAMQLQEAMEIPEMAEALKGIKTADEALKLVKKFEEKLVTTELARRQVDIKDKGMLDMLKVAAANYRVGDALKGMAELPKDMFSLSFIEVDPPYGINLNEQKKQTDSTSNVVSYNEVATAEYQAFVEVIAEETFRVAGKDCWMIFWYGPTHHHMIYTALKNAGWEVDDIPAIWTKGGGQTNAPEFYLARSYEPFFVCRKGKPLLHKRGRSNVFEFSPVAGTKKYHPTERPMALMAELLEVFTFEASNSVVLVPFLGSGVTLRACYLRGLKCFGWDLNGEYKDKFMLAVQADTEQLNKQQPNEE